MKLQSILPEIKQIRASTEQIIMEVTDDDCPLQIESRGDIVKETGNIKACLLRIEAINI